MVIVKKSYGLKRKISCVLIVFLFLSSTVWAQSTQVFFSPQGGCQQVIIHEVAKAKKTIDIAMYNLTSEPIAQEIVRMRKRGVAVRIFLDKGQKTQKASQAGFLKSQGVTLRLHQGSGLMHHKFAVIDKTVLITGSFNWTENAEKDNAENLLILSDKKLAAEYTKEFENLWVQGREAQMSQSLDKVISDMVKYLLRFFKKVMRRYHFS
jgi:phosphatidylserine/phosphatidylglycerophosphate/cardiolipin synthase-like enzyme